MRQRKSGGALRQALWGVVFLAFFASTLLAQVRPAYLYTLSNFSGRIPYDSAQIGVDQGGDEVYVIYQNLVRIFGPSGMEVFSFGDDLDLGQLLAATSDENGDIILLSYKNGRSVVTRCNYRGVPLGQIDVRNLPAGVTFGANRMVHRNGLLYFASLADLKVIVTDVTGNYRSHVDFAPLLEGGERQNADTEMFGFTVDQDGNMLFTIPVHFRVYRFSPDGKLSSFGRSGSAPGRFGVIAGIATDTQGDVLVADKLKSAIMVFDKDFNFLTEFGYRGTKPGNLIAPDDIAVDRKDRVYVSQGRKRGVSVFALAPN